MQPFHKSIISTMSCVTIIAGNELLAVGGLAFAASLMATTTIPGEPNDIFASFGTKFDEVNANDNPDLLVALAEGVGNAIKEHVGDMDVATATFFKSKNDAVRDHIAVISPDSMHRLETSTYLGQALVERIEALTPPNDADLDADKQAGTGRQAADSELAQA